MANYGLNKWLKLPRYIPEENTRLLLKSCYRQYRQYSKVQTVLKNNLISWLDSMFPGVNRLFSSPVRGDVRGKWVDFVSEFWHCQCVSKHSEKVFTNRYQKWCKKNCYNFSAEKAHEIHIYAKSQIGVMPQSDTSRVLVEKAVSQLRATSTALIALKREMNTLAYQLSEYPVVMAMYGVGPALGPQFMAEIGNVRHFYSKKALVVFTGIDTSPNDFEQIVGNHKSMSKIGTSALRRTFVSGHGCLSTNIAGGRAGAPVHGQEMSRGKAV